jgi:hypothetical protein
MSNFYDTILLEQRIQKAVIVRNRKIIAEAPEGTLSIRNRKMKRAYYQEIKNAEFSRQINITKDPDMITALTVKAIAAKRISRARVNLKALEQMKRRYQSTEAEDILAQLPDKYTDAVNMLRQRHIDDWMSAEYDRAPFDPEAHIHETCYGDLVRSKSEQIIANALYSYGIPFRYEEKFKYPSENGDWYYPDFTILLPDGSTLIWEHFGLLKNLGYCIHNGYKLHTYQKNNYVIGKNLIITQDDNKGNCSGAIIYGIIEKQILPLFAGLSLKGHIMQ